MTSDKDPSAELLEGLSQLSLQYSREQRIKCMQHLINGLNRDDIDRSSYTGKLIEKNILAELQCIITSEDPIESSKGAELLAEMAKEECVRVACVQADVVPALVNMLTTPDVNSSTQVQACRALGNICFDNDSGRQVVDTCGGVEKLLQLLQNQLGNSKPDCDKLRTVSCGFLLNLTNTHESLQEKAINLGVIEVLKKYLEQHIAEEGTCHMALLCLSSFSDSDSGKEKIEGTKVSAVIAGLLDTSIGDDLLDSILDLLATLSESEEVKSQLAECGICSKLLQIIKDNTDDRNEECVQLQKLASDLIVLLLTGDKSMDLLYGNGKTSCYKDITGWLDSSKSEQLQISGALAVGNFARNDKNCGQLVEDGITEKLLSFLRHPADDVSVTLQHAAFSALKNMAIPASNKPVMLKADLLQAVLPYARTDMSPVQFKLLGLLRMLIDGQESAAIELGTNMEFMPRLVSLCAVDEHAGVKGEACRLLSWLIKHSRSAEVMKAVIQSNGVHHLVWMATSEHVLMQNEALVALSLLASALLDDAAETFLAGNFIAMLTELLENKDTLPEIVTNVLLLVELVTPSDKIRNQLKTEDFVRLLKQSKKHSEDMVKKQATKSLEALEST